MTDFCESVKKHFQFLETEYDCKLESSHIEDWGGEVIYLNQTTGIKLLYEFSSAFIFVFIYKLVNRKMVDNPRPVTESSKIYCFDFNDALPEGEKMKPAYEYGASSNYYDEVNGISNYTQEFASRLERNGGGVLSGDFSILSIMEDIIIERACSNS
jgi:hypothetical protein